MNLPPRADRLTVRWTIGRVRPRGFEMLRLSMLCAVRLFGPATRYRVCVNTLPIAEVQARTGPVPEAIEWRSVNRDDVPPVLRPHCTGDLMQGMGWKLTPLRTDLGRFELALDNDCILWDLPTAMAEWLEAGTGALLAEDVDRCLGRFDALCPPGALNAGIRGLPPDADLATALAHVLRAVEPAPGEQVQLVDEIEEQGLQAAAVARIAPLFFVSADEVSICSPFWPRSPELGSCGAHFVGMNARHTPWNYYDRPADEWLDEHWSRHRAALYERAGLPLPTESAFDL